MDLEDIFDESLGPEALVINYNKLALAELHNDNARLSEQLFRKAENYLKFVNQNSYALLKSMTMNNLSNMFIACKNYDKSLECLSSILSQNLKGTKTNVAITYLNISSVKSLQSKYDEAIEDNLKALSILKESLQMTPNIVNSIIICYYNTAIAYKNIGSTEEYHKYMKGAWELAIEQLGPDHILTQVSFKEISESLPENSFVHVKIQKNLENFGIAKEKKKLDEILKSKSRNSSLNPMDFNQTRFITGERLQPMHKTKYYRKKVPRPLSRPSSRTSRSVIEASNCKKNSDFIRKPALPLPVKEHGKFTEKIKMLHEKIGSEDKSLKVLNEVPDEPSSKNSVAFIPNFDDIEEFDRNQAAIKIQKNIRGRNSRKKFKEQKEKYRENARVIAKAAQVMVARSEIENIKKKINNAGKNIANAFRGFLGKKRLAFERKKISSIPEVDEEKEEDLSEVNRTEIPEKDEENAVEIQAENSVEAKPEKKVRSYDENIVYIQSFVRKKNESKKYKKTRSSIIKIQSLVRMWLVRIIYKSIHEAIIFIQAVYRGYRVRKALSLRKKNLNN